MLERPVRLFHVVALGDARTGPLDHDRRFVGSRADFRAGLRHVLLEPGQEKSSVGAWCPVDALTRAEGATFATRAGYEYAEPNAVGRHLENVTGSCASVFLDIDKLPVAEWPALLTKLRAWSGEVWSTASYSSSASTVSVRVHLHLDRELAVEEVESVRRRVSAVLGNVTDRACFPRTAVFYLPASRGEHFVEYLDGQEIVVDALPVLEVSNRAARPMPKGYVVLEVDRERALNELGSLADRIRTCTAGLRRYTALAALSVGQRIAAGILDRAAAEQVLEEAIAYQREACGDDKCTLEERYEQLYSGIEDGLAKGPALPADRATPRELILESLAENPAFVTADVAAASAPAGHILALPPGVGKSRTALRVISNSRQDAVVYAPSHALAEEHRSVLLEFGVPADDIRHVYSPLHRPEGGEEGCERSRASRGPETLDSDPSPFANAVRAAHVNLRATICPRCPVRETCPVRFAPKAAARVTLSVHAAYEAVEDPGKALVYLDEEPAPLERLSVSRDALAALAGRSDVYASLTGAAHAFWTPQQVAAETARVAYEADLADEPDAGFDPGQGYYVRQAALALRAGRPVPEPIRLGLAQYAGDVRLSSAVAESLLANPSGGFGVDPSELEPVRAVIGLATAVETRALPDGLEAIVEAPSRRDVRRGYATLLSATPTPMAYGDLPIYAPVVADGCEGIVRQVLYLSRGSNVAFKADVKAQVARTAELLRLSGRSFAGQRILVVTFKQCVANHAESFRDLFPGAEVLLRWFGAVAGSNLFQEAAELEVDAIVTVGDYYANRRWMFEHLAREAGKEGDALLDAVESAGRLQVRQELAQAHGRARDPRRTRPVTHLHVGQELPLGWEGRCGRPLFLEEALVEERKVVQSRLLGYLRAGIEKTSMASVARVLGLSVKYVKELARGSKPIDAKHEPKLRHILGLSNNV